MISMVIAIVVKKPWACFFAWLFWSGFLMALLVHLHNEAMREPIPAEVILIALAFDGILLLVVRRIHQKLFPHKWPDLKEAENAE